MVLAISLIYFARKLLKTLNKMKNPEDPASENEKMLRNMTVMFAVTYGVRAVYSAFQGQYWRIISSYVAR